jgi:predicted metal-dependent HD superfamily phosphohydrolase
VRTDRPRPGDHRAAAGCVHRFVHRRLLDRVLARARIYANLPFALREGQARANLARAIGQLRT